MSNTFTTQLTPSYIKIRSLYLGVEHARTGSLTPGRIPVLIADDKTFSVEGTLNSKGLLSSLTKLFTYLGLTDGQTVTYQIQNGTVIIESPRTPTSPVTPSESRPADDNQPSPPETVFKRKQLRHIHIEPFRPENLNVWEPKTEVDVYLAFGVLQEYTDYQYCCGASASLLKQLGATYNETAKPDAILIDRNSEEYMMAEWKMRSSDFKSNHKPEDVDVLVCWYNDEIESANLPPKVLALQEVARVAANTLLEGGVS